MKNKLLALSIAIGFSFLSVYGNDISFVVNTRKIRGTVLKSEQKLSGSVISNREVRVTAPVSCSVSAVHVIDGEWVTRGEKLLTFSRESLDRVLKEKLNEVKKWEKILWDREHWAQREKSAEDAAKQQIRKLKNDIKRVNRLLKDPVVISDGEGKVLRIVSSGKKVSAGSEMAVIADDYVMKIPVPEGKRNLFFKGMRLQMNFPEKKIWRSGKVRAEAGRLMIFINNPDLKISAGMKAVYTVTVRKKGAILLRENEFRKDPEGNSYVYVSSSGSGMKRIVKLDGQTAGGYLVHSGLRIGETLISPIVDTDADQFTISGRVPDVQKDVAAVTTTGRSKRVKKTPFTLGKKMEYVVSAGVSFSKPDFLIAKNSGIRDSITQYSDHFGLLSANTGEFKENLTGIPVRVTLNYKLSDGLYLKFGGEYSTMSNSSSSGFDVNWPSITEEIDYSLRNSITTITPFAGIEKRFSSFGMYAILGLNLTRFNHTATIIINDGSHNMESVEEIKSSGTGIGILLGAKYMFRIGEKFGLSLKLEYAIHSVGSLSGDKIVTVNDSISGNNRLTETGTLYEYDIDPYGEGGFGWWDLHSSAPSGTDVSNVNELALKLSRIRFLIGFSF